MPSKTIRSVTAAAVAVAVMCTAAYLPASRERFGDFRAFYCAGRAVVTSADPYREHPLRECEYAAAAPGVSPVRDDMAIPAPFPGYVLALFAVLALLPFGIAAALWLAASIASVVLACLFFARCVRLPVTALGILIGFPTLTAALVLGQLTPFVALAISAAALLLARGKPRAAGIAALGIALEPHVAAAVFFALFIAVRQTRGALITGCALLASISLFVLGPNGNIEYVREVLPAHALANITDAQQFSAASMAALFGVGLVAARTIGSWSYIAAATIGVAAAVRLRRCCGSQAVVLVPVAFEMFGGIHVHVAQLAFAIPAFLLVTPRGGRLRAPALVALFVAAIPWNLMVNYPMMAPAIAALAIAFCISLDVERLALPLAIGATLMFFVFFGTGLCVFGGSALHYSAYYPKGNPFAEDSWQHWQRWRAAQRSTSEAVWLIAVRIPTFAAFATLVGALTTVALRLNPPRMATRPTAPFFTTSAS